MAKFAPVPIKIMEKKFYIKELLQFLIEKRQTVILDGNFIFTVEEFKKFIAKNKLPKEMFVKTSFYSIEESLKYLKEMDIRDVSGHIINPPLPLLNYIALRLGFLTLFPAVLFVRRPQSQLFPFFRVCLRLWCFARRCGGVSCGDSKLFSNLFSRPSYIYP